LKLLKTHPFLSLVNSYVIDSPSPSNISYLWNYGSLLGVVLVIQIATGVTLAMHYVPHVDLAFISVEHIMRDVNYGWMIRYFHANGAAFFFIFIYIHMAKGLYYGSYKAPRVMLWSIGVIIFLLLIITGFLGLETSLKWLNINIQSEPFQQTSFLVSTIVPISSQNNSSNKEDNKLSYWLNHYNIKPELIYESLYKDEIKENIKIETRKKTGIYGIFNIKTGDFYIGSAITNKFYSRFYKHLIKGIGSKYVFNSVNKYGIENFAFVILEFFPEEVTKKNNKELMDLETKWIKTYSPSYNILLEAGNSFGYKHTEETKQKMKENYSDERRNKVASINKNKPLSDHTKYLMRERALNMSNETKKKISVTLSKSVTLYNLDSSIYTSFSGLYEMAKYFKCDIKTINKAIENNKLFKKQWYVKFNNPSK
jgi:group I intron endonuclease